MTKRTQLELKNAREKIEGYYLPSVIKPGNEVDEFKRAQQECISNLEQQLSIIRTFSPTQFFSKKFL